MNSEIKINIVFEGAVEKSINYHHTGQGEAEIRYPVSRKLLFFS